MSYLISIKKSALKALSKIDVVQRQQLVDAIEKSKAIPYEAVLFALGIRYVGETVAKKLAKAFPTIEKRMNK